MSKLAAGLRDLADWVEQNPEYEDEIGTLGVSVCFLTCAAFADAARALGHGMKIAEGSYFTVRRSFGPVNLDFFTARENVCRRVVVDTIERPERIIPAHTEEVVE